MGKERSVALHTELEGIEKVESDIVALRAEAQQEEVKMADAKGKLTTLYDRINELKNTRDQALKVFLSNLKQG